MAGIRVKTSLATKFRLLLGLSVLVIIVAALILPWYFMELLAAESVQQRGAALTRLRINEHLRDPAKGFGADSEVAALYTAAQPAEGRRGPVFSRLRPGPQGNQTLDPLARQAEKAFRRNPQQDMAVFRSLDGEGRNVYRSFRAVRSEPTCMRCHGPAASPHLRFQPGELVGMVDVTVPASAAVGTLVWWTRGMFIAGAVLAAVLALLLFSLITQRLVLRPVRQLRDMADKVAEGNLEVRSHVRTGDELERLGESFNEMLAAITDQHEKLRTANRALDLKLREVAEANVTLFEANRVKTEFLANVSHELRTPLNSIIGFAELVSEAREERISRYGRNISAAAKNLLKMINDLLDLASIEAGKATVHLEKVSVLDTCQTLLALMQPLAEKKELDLTGQLDPNLPMITTDGSKLQQVLYNLLSNAVKFTPARGKVVLSATTKTPSGDGADGTGVVITVADTGPGISQADQQQIFEKFYQSGSSLTKESSGVGLGLAIARELTQLLGGRLTLESTPGHGAAFSVHLPLAPKPAAHSPGKP